MITIYTDRFIPKRHQAVTRGPIILIRPEHRDDRGLLEHEREHVRQWLAVSIMACSILGLLIYALMGVEMIQWAALGMGVHGALYSLVPEYRLASEIDAFREQARHYPDDRIPTFAALLTSNYDLDIYFDEALRELRK